MTLENKEESRIENKTTEDTSIHEALHAEAIGHAALGGAASGAIASVSERVGNSAHAMGKGVTEAFGKLVIESTQSAQKTGVALVEGIAHGIQATYDKDGRQTSDCFGPLPRVERFPFPDQDWTDIFKPKKDGVEKLSSGDYIVREDGKQKLFTPGGDSISINPDGSNTIKGDVSKVSTDRFGETTVSFEDGSKVCFDKDGFNSIQRNGETVFSREGSVRIQDIILPKCPDDKVFGTGK